MLGDFERGHQQALGALDELAVLERLLRLLDFRFERLELGMPQMGELLGSVLVDARGRTLYAFDKDRKGMSACETACATYWPPLVARMTPHGGKGVHQSLLGVVRRRDGRSQVTYAGHPLYTFVGDKARGQTNGQGLTDFGAEWYVVAASGQTVERRVPSSGGYGSGGGY